uniref:Structure-specific endonuclease subunit SLX4 n=1 Tax=Glossina pallidipes TaxID=7398 RepID=A0A1B0AIG1_GLOPL
MDREKRKANLKKLQLPSTKTHQIRECSSTNTAMTTSILSYFTTPEKQKPPAVNEIFKGSHQSLNEDNIIFSSNRPKRTKLDRFVGRESKKANSPFKQSPLKAKVGANENDFVEPLERIKKTPGSIKSKRTARKCKGNKKQALIKSAFLRNEQMFAEIAAQHCAAEQFDGEEIQLALAISQSEAESKCFLSGEDDDRESNTESIKKKLEKYGFRTANKQDYSSFAMAFAMANDGRRQRRRWANKFTALTLRNAEIQRKKVQNHIDSLLQRQFQQQISKETEELSQTTYSVLSALLRRSHCKTKDLLQWNAITATAKTFEHYFVKELFEVNVLPSNRLLKEWSAIQGRDLSPTPEQRENREAQHLKLQSIYNDLEIYFNHSRPSIHSEHIGDVSVKNFNNNKSPIERSQLKNAIDINEKQDNKTNAIEEDARTSSSDSTLLNTADSVTQNLNTTIKDLSLALAKETSNMEAIISSTQTSKHPKSPDLFADSDSDVEIEDKSKDFVSDAESKQMNDLLRKDNNDSSMENVDELITYEIYTSDEVKTPSLVPLYNTTTYHTLEYDFNDVKDEFKSVYHKPQNISQFVEGIDLFESTESENKGSSFKHLLVMDTLDKTENFPELTLSMETKNSHLQNHGEALNKRDEILNEKSFEFALGLELNKSPEIGINKDMSKGQDDDEIFQELKRKYLNIPNTVQNDNSYINANSNLRKSASFSLNTHITPKSENFHKTNSFNLQVDKKINESEIYIDLSQDDDAEDDNASDECLLLSDDEINYSIWKANRVSDSFDEYEIKSKKSLAFDYQEKDGHSDIPQTFQSSFFESENNDDFLPENVLLDNEPLVPTQTEEVFDFSFLESSSEKSIPSKYFSENFSKKFKSLSQTNVLQTEPALTSSSYNDDFDEFDLLLEAGPSKSIPVPKGIDQLLEGDISYLKTQEKTREDLEIFNESITFDSQELEVNGKIYTVREVESPKPDFSTLSETELLNRLYGYGIKPLKRKQAVKILEYIYNQTHPLIDYEENIIENVIDINSPSKPKAATQITSNPYSINNNKNNISDGTGKQMLHYNNELKAEFIDEQYILQTNVTKKTAQPLLPFHIAWYNLLSCNHYLHESILMYEPIDLQEIYLFLKNLGYRYDPKDLKAFFDRRCIIFRYDMTPPAVGSVSNREHQRNRHIRKNKSVNLS